MNAGIAPLRSSCDRCRIQKLRCVPSSDTKSPAPCERCSKAKVNRSCVFSKRSRTGRYKKSSDIGTRHSRKDAEQFSSTLPGMGAFALCDPGDISSRMSPSNEGKQGNSSMLQEAEQGSSVMGEADGVAQAGILADVWNQDNSLFLSACLDPSLSHPGPTDFILGADDSADDSYQYKCGNTEPSDDVTANIKTGSNTFAIARYLDAQELFVPAQQADTTTTAPTTTNDDDICTETSVANTSGPMLELTAILSELSRYETQLCNLPAKTPSELDNYPIGDALFLSQRFQSIISQDDRAVRDMPTVLLTLSCYLTLTRIYSSVFVYLHEHLSHLLTAHETHGPLPLVPSDMHAYRGLRLNQLRPICLCAGWNPIKKAVSILLGLLAGTEAALGLSADVRVSEAQLMGDGGKVGAASSPRGSASVGGESAVLFEEGFMSPLTDRRLYKSVKEQASDLRDKVAKVNILLKRLDDR